MSASEKTKSSYPCPECGARPVPGAKFCWLCGRAVTPDKSLLQANIAAPHHNESNASTLQSVLWIALLFGVFGLIAFVSSIWDDLLSDPLLRNAAITVGLPALAIITIVTILAVRPGRASSSGTTLMVGALGMMGVVAVSLFAAMAVVAASGIAFFLTCGLAGRLPP